MVTHIVCFVSEPSEQTQGSINPSYGGRKTNFTLAQKQGAGQTGSQTRSLSIQGEAKEMLSRIEISNSIFLLTILLTFVMANNVCWPNQELGKPCNFVQYYEEMRSRMSESLLLQQENFQGDVLQSPNYAVVQRSFPYTQYYSEKMWHSALWGLAVDMANKSGTKVELRNDPNYERILEVGSLILQSASERGIREVIPIVNQQLGVVKSLMSSGSEKYITLRNSLQEASGFMAGVASILTSVKGFSQIMKAPFFVDYLVEWYYYAHFIIPEVKKTGFSVTNPVLGRVVNDYQKSLYISYSNYTAALAEQLTYVVGSGIVAGAISGSGVIPGPGTVGGAIIGAAIGAALGITSEVLAGGTQFVLNHDIASRQITLALAMRSATTINAKYLRTLCLQNGLLTISDKMLGDGLQAIVQQLLGTRKKPEAERWQSFMTLYFQPARSNTEGCLTEGIAMLSMTNVDQPRSSDELPNLFLDKRDRQEYRTVRIGDQTWMAENLNYATGKGSWCYNDNPSLCKKFGKLYSYEAATTVCPAGWHLPTLQDWEILSTTLSHGFHEDHIVKNQKTAILEALEQSAFVGAKLLKGETGFNPLLGGYREDNGVFIEKGTSTGFWGYVRDNLLGKPVFVIVDDGSFPRAGLTQRLIYGEEQPGFCVRCLKNQ
jgi:uncharacterized protein (TIGR02145 family)